MVQESLTDQELVFKWTRNYCIEVQVAIHVRRDETVMSLEKFADLDLGERQITIWD